MTDKHLSRGALNTPEELIQDVSKDIVRISLDLTPHEFGDMLDALERSILRWRRNIAMDTINVMEWPNMHSRKAGQTDPGEDWTKRIVILWEEGDPSTEGAQQAFERITGSPCTNLDKIKEKREVGGTIILLYSTGWVIGWSSEGGMVGKLADMEFEKR